MTTKNDSPDPLDDFGVMVSFDRGSVVLGIRGEVDLVTAPDLGALLNALIDQGHGSIILDLAEVAFMGSQGLGVIASGVARLGAIGHELTIRSVPTLVGRILEVTGLNEVVRLEESEPVLDRLGPEEAAGAQSARATVGAGDLSRLLRRATAIPTDRDVVDGALRLVVSLALATVEGADGVSVSLQRHGRLATVAATDQTILDMDAEQYATGEGPCVAASVEGRWFHVESLENETRWPRFAPKARQLGINAILSSPLSVQDRPLGALNIYSRTQATFSETEQKLAAVFAREASIILRDAQVDVSAVQLSEQLTEALEARQTIAWAEGVVMEREGVTPDEAFGLLLTFSRSSDQPLIECAAELVDSTRRAPARPSLESEDT